MPDKFPPRAQRGAPLNPAVSSEAVVSAHMRLSLRHRSAMCALAGYRLA